MTFAFAVSKTSVTKPITFSCKDVDDCNVFDCIPTSNRIGFLCIPGSVTYDDSHSFCLVELWVQSSVNGKM